MDGLCKKIEMLKRGTLMEKQNPIIEAIIVLCNGNLGGTTR